MAIGLINHAVPTEEPGKFYNGNGKYNKHNAPLAISVIKEEMRVLSEASPLNPEAFEKIQAGRRTVYNSKDYAEAIKCFFEKRKPVFVGE